MNEDLQMLTPKEEESKIEALKDELLWALSLDEITWENAMNS